MSASVVAPFHCSFREQQSKATTIAYADSIRGGKENDNTNAIVVLLVVVVCVVPSSGIP